MSLRLKNILYSLVLLVALVVVWKIRQGRTFPEVRIEGKTMGTTYHITYFDEQNRNFKSQVDSLLDVFNSSMNTYLTNSEITRFNTGQQLKFELPFFLPVLKKSEEVVSASGGAFDPTVMPLVNAWGFGPGKKMKPDSLQIDSIREFVGFEKINYNQDSVWKEDARVQLDFSAIAKGYGVDLVAEFIKSQGVDNVFVEIGGEIVAAGKNLKKKAPWEVGILDPNSTYVNQFYRAYASLTDKAMATSGNYFNYYEEEGKKYSHTIDPATGYSVQRELLSASVFADDCMTADAWATAFMVMGHDKAIEVLKKHKELDGYLIFTEGDKTKTFVSGGIKPFIRE